jgi:hypothetical protein
MNVLHVPYITALITDSADVLSTTFQSIESTAITNEPWPAGGIKPNVEFKMAYGTDAVFLKFDVKEKYFRANNKLINDPVFNDTCVEFFIAFDNDAAYYNLEFNALGTPLVGFGTGRERKLTNAPLIKTIKRTGVVNVVEDDALPYQWELTVTIPFNVFYNHPITTLNGVSCRANFYKCGDELPEPHYLCWNNIIADKPNFHLPEYFGQLIFV